MATLLHVDPRKPDASALAEAADCLREGGLVAFPTETVYGLGAHAMNEAAVRRIFEAKGRPAEDPIIVHVTGLDAAHALTPMIPDLALRLAGVFWPGPLTLVVPRGPRIPGVVTAGLDSVALRAPAHPVAMALLEAVGLPIAAPSANLFGRTSPTTAAHVMADLGERIDIIIDGGRADVGLESTVVDCRGERPVVLRPGGVSVEALRAAVGEVALAQARTSEPDTDTVHESLAELRSPGTMLRHYAPAAHLVLVTGAGPDVVGLFERATRRLRALGATVGLLIAEEDRASLAGDVAGTELRTLGSAEDMQAVAHALFASLRELDMAGVDLILARDFGASGLGLAIRDRLTRAAEGRVIDLNAFDDADEAVSQILDAYDRA